MRPHRSSMHVAWRDTLADFEEAIRATKEALRCSLRRSEAQEMQKNLYRLRDGVNALYRVRSLAKHIAGNRWEARAIARAMRERKPG